MLPNILGNPCCSSIDNNRQISASFGALRYQSPKTSTIALTKALRLSIAVVSPIRRYSSVRSRGIPYTICKYLVSCSYLFKARKTKNTKSICHLFEIWIVSFHYICDPKKKTTTHPKSSLKLTFSEFRIFSKIIII